MGEKGRMSEASDSTFWLLVVAIVAFAVCRCFSCWCDCQIEKKREETQAAYWESLAEMLEKQREVQQEIIKTLQR